ncbi:hypothetical protein C3L33_00631, partial [Rhododendron williamsianum]
MKELHISTTGSSSSTKNKMMVSVLLLFFFLLAAGVGAGAQDKSDECIPRRCGDKGPEIRFPFWLKDLQPERCGYGPGFALTCSPTNTTETLLDNPFSVKVTVTEINYYCQLIRYEFSGNYVPEDQQNLSLIFNTSPGYPLSPFQLWAHPVSDYRVFRCRIYSGNYLYEYYDYPSGRFCEYHIFSCPSSLADSYNDNDYAPLPWLSRPGRSVYLLRSDYLIRRTLLNCSKMYTIPSVAPCISLYQYSYYGLREWSAWSEPAGCRKCEENGKYCRSSRSNHSKKNETECFDPPRGTSDHLILRKIKVYFTFPRPFSETKRPHHETGLIPVSLFVLVVLVIATYFVHRTNNKKEDQVKVERFLENYRALRPTRYTYAEIKKITYNFKDKLGQGGYGIVYKGVLSKDVPIAAKILNNFTEVNNNEVEEGGDAKIIKKLTVVGLWCIQWYPGDRPSMKAVVQMLEGDGDTLGMPPNPFSTTSQSISRGNMGERPFSSMLEIISESD